MPPKKKSKHNISGLKSQKPQTTSALISAQKQPSQSAPSEHATTVSDTFDKNDNYGEGWNPHQEHVSLNIEAVLN